MRIAHIHECSEDTFWHVFFDPDYNRQLFSQALGFPHFEQLEFRETETEIRRVVSATPSIGELPHALKKLVGDGITYEERGIFDKRTKRFSIEVISNKLPDRITVRGTIYTEPISDARSRRVFDGTVEARIFGVGGLLEKRLIADLEARYADSARFTNQYVKGQSPVAG